MSKKGFARVVDDLERCVEVDLPPGWLAWDVHLAGQQVALETLAYAILPRLPQADREKLLRGISGAMWGVPMPSDRLRNLREELASLLTAEAPSAT